MSGTIQTQALWNWTTTANEAPVVQTYPTKNNNTKSGLQPADLAAYLQVPLQQFGNPSIPIPDSVVSRWIRWAEDDIETETNIRLCQTWIAAPAAKSAAEVLALNIGVQYSYQQLGVDYDYAEAGYDFEFERWRDEGWGYQRMRWRPVKSVEYYIPNPGPIDVSNFTGTKNVAFIYPLLNEYFRMPSTWVVEDQNRGLLRFVPAVSIQMLPLFALQLAFMGFAQSVPSGLWFQYTAGLTANDYMSEWSFMEQLILARAGMTAFAAMQTSLNYGALETTTQVDGLSYRIKYGDKGPFFAQINNLKEVSTRLTRRAKSMGGGIHMGIL